MGKTRDVQTDLGEICFVGNMRLYQRLSETMMAFLDCALGTKEIFTFLSPTCFLHRVVFLFSTD